MTATAKFLVFAILWWMMTPGASSWAQQATGGKPGPMLDAEMQVVAESPDPGRLFVYEPALVKLPSGRLLVTFEHTRIDANAEVPHRFRLAISEDAGRTWRQLPPLDLHSAQPFVHKSELYLLGNVAIRRNIVILRSGDEGRSWTGPVTLFEGSYWNAPTGVLDQGRASLPVLQPARERRRHAKSAELPGVRGHRCRTSPGISWTRPPGECPTVWTTRGPRGC